MRIVSTVTFLKTINVNLVGIHDLFCPNGESMIKSPVHCKLILFGAKSSYWHWLDIEWSHLKVLLFNIKGTICKLSQQYR